jgi:enoyl-[acyl-carrier protein] reductase/trans-2-enoyl-CoA reductase (NAD+)
MRPDVQQEITQLWDTISSENVEQLADVEGFHKEFLQCHGFDMPGVDYTQDVAVDVC